MGIGKQTLDAEGQPVLIPRKFCLHGVQQDVRGNSSCEECFEDRLTDSYLLGIAVGYEQYSAKLGTQAGVAYAAGKDDLAKILRDLSKEVAKLGVEGREAQKKHAVDVKLDQAI